MIVALAGHVDHGKTQLVKALTGTDTDRLPEEKQRGMTLDLGFAHLDFEGCEPLDFIDVPGHERFLRNMLAGVSRIDAALLVVAADDGIMPQTTEHLDILDLLGVTRGAVAVSKTDRVPAARLRQVVGTLQDALRPTSLCKAPIFPVSSVTGDGLAALQAWLHAEAAQSACLPDPEHGFRMPIDRAFTLPGAGTIVTGTVHSGEVHAGSTLVLAPAGRRVRVRGLQIHGRAAGRATRDQRCALNLTDVSVREAARGQWLVSESAQGSTRRFDARVRVLAHAEHPLKHWTPVHLHHGTADLLARIAVVGEEQIPPGATRLVQIVPQEPVHALLGDRFILRDQSARHTLAGGVVLNPFATRRLRHERLIALRQVYARPSPTGILAGLLEQDTAGVDLQQLARALNLTPVGIQALLRDTPAVVLNSHPAIALAPALAETLTAATLAALRDFHHQQPQAAGMPLKSLQTRVAASLTESAFRAFLGRLADRQHLVLSNDLLRLPDHDTTANAEDVALWPRVCEALRTAGIRTPLLADLARQLALEEQPLRDFLHRKSRSGEVLCITPNRFCLRETLAALIDTARSVAQARTDGWFTAADFRDAIGTGRGLAIHYLEFFDQIGVTRRAGDRRRMARHDEQPLYASAPSSANTTSRPPAAHRRTDGETGGQPPETSH